MMWWNQDAWGVGAWASMLLTMALFWAGIIALVGWIVQSVRPENPSARESSLAKAENVLAERFARGDIDEEEFRRRRSALHS